MSAGEHESIGGGGAVVVDPLGGLVLDPSNELRFKGPFDDYVTVSLTIRNPTEKRVAFKIKTTAPKRYCVKPNSGVLDPEQTMKVNVLLQPFNYDPNEKNKHKFMVQYLYLNDEEMQLNVNDILNMVSFFCDKNWNIMLSQFCVCYSKWKDVSTSRLLDLKLKCIFESTEADQSKHINDASTTTFSNTTIPFSTQSTAVESKQVSKPVVPAATQPASRMSTARQSDVFANADSNEYELKTGAPIVNSTPIVQNTNSQMPAPSQPARPTPPAVPTVTSSATSTRQADSNNKNENLVNELKLAMQDNEALKREVARLKVFFLFLVIILF